MILVVNPNPAVDKIAVVDFVMGRTLRPIRVFEWPGGSGVHAAHVAHVLGADVEVVCPVGGLQGERFLDLARSHGLRVTPVRVEGETRGTFTLLDRERGNMCDVADPGADQSPATADETLRATRERIDGAELAVISGSTPAGWPVEFPGEVVRLCGQAGVKVIADLTGEALRTAVQEHPWLVKPSLEELRRDGLVGPTPTEVLELVNGWIQLGVENVCLSLASGGVLWASRAGLKRVGIAPGRVWNTVGSGDTLVGALAASSVRGCSVEDALRWGVAAATSNLNRAEPGDCTPEEVRDLFDTTFVEPADEASLEVALAQA